MTDAGAPPRLRRRVRAGLSRRTAHDPVDVVGPSPDGVLQNCYSTGLTLRNRMICMRNPCCWYRSTIGGAEIPVRGAATVWVAVWVRDGRIEGEAPAFGGAVEIEV